MCAISPSATKTRYGIPHRNSPPPPNTTPTPAPRSRPPPRRSSVAKKFRQNAVTETFSATNAFSPIESNISHAAGTRRLFPARPAHKLAFTVRANVVHCLGARRAIGALVTADVSYPAVCKRRPALFTFAFQFQCHERKSTRNDRYLRAID